MISQNPDYTLSQLLRVAGGPYVSKAVGDVWDSAWFEYLSEVRCAATDRRQQHKSQEKRVNLFSLGELNGCVRYRCYATVTVIFIQSYQQ